MTPINPITPIAWWKFIYDAKTKTWGAYGRVAFVQAETEDAARAAGIEAAKAEYPQSAIEPFAIGQSTAAAAAVFADRRARYARWLDNTRTGTPNLRKDLT